MAVLTGLLAAVDLLALLAACRAAGLADAAIDERGRRIEGLVARGDAG